MTNLKTTILLVYRKKTDCPELALDFTQILYGVLKGSSYEGKVHSMHLFCHVGHVSNPYCTA